MNVKPLLTVVFLMLTSCSHKNNKTPVEGKFIFSGRGISTLDLESGEVVKLISTPSRLIKHFDFVDNEKLLVSIYELHATVTREKIEIWSLDGKVLQALENGSNAMYFKKHDTMVFYNSNGDLAYRALSNTASKHTVIEQNNRFPNEPVIKTSENTFLYIKETNNAYSVFEYSFLTQTSIEKPEFKDCGFYKSIWVSKSQSLLCQQRKPTGKITGDYFLIDQNRHRISLDFEASEIWPLTLFESDSLLLLQQRTSENLGAKETHPLWVYDLQKKTLIKVAQNIYIPSKITSFKQE